MDKQQVIKILNEEFCQVELKKAAANILIKGESLFKSAKTYGVDRKLLSNLILTVHEKADDKTDHETGLVLVKENAFKLNEWVGSFETKKDAALSFGVSDQKLHRLLNDNCYVINGVIYSEEKKLNDGRNGNIGRPSKHGFREMLVGDKKDYSQDPRAYIKAAMAARSMSYRTDFRFEVNSSELTITRVQ